MGNNRMIREELLQMVSDLSDEQLNERVQEGSWTIAEVLEHLHLTEKFVAEMMADVLVKEERRPAEEKPIHLVLDRSQKVEAPSLVAPSEVFKTLDEMKEKLLQSRQTLTKIVEAASPDDLQQRSYPHPVFGRISLAQWIAVVGLHEKRHLEQIRELKEKLENS